MKMLYLYDEKGFFIEAVQERVDAEYHHYLEEAPDFEKYSSDIYLAKANAEKQKWEYVKTPEIIEKEKAEESKRKKEEEKQQKLEEKRKEEEKNKIILTFIPSASPMKLTL